MKENGTRRHRRLRMHEVIFEADTPAGKWFDVLLILAILTSVAVVMLDSSCRTLSSRMLLNTWLRIFAFR